MTRTSPSSSRPRRGNQPSRAVQFRGHSAQGLQPASMVVKKKASSTDNMQVDDDDRVSEDDEEEVAAAALREEEAQGAFRRLPRVPRASSLVTSR